MIAERGVVEEDARDDERPGQRPAAGLIGSGDPANAEAAVEA
jgi:hypothetical protein